VAEENAELISILNKMLGLLTQKKKNDIYNNWVTRQKQLVDYSLIWKIMLVASVFLVLMLYWNRRLAHEVSLRKIAEKQALRASSAKSDFLANMSHEIRTPMNSVLGFAELLDNMIGDAEQKSYLKSIRTGGKALLEIINDILDLSKIEAGKMAIRPEPLSLQALFDEIHDFFKARMAQKNLLFIIQVAEDFPRYITMDSMRLRQVLVNLIGNALKFTESGSICLDCHDVEIDEDKDVVSFTLTVADTGVGIPPEQQQAIFNKFEQQEGQDNARYGGTGLGLSICRSLTELMGGQISVSSSPGKGSHFNVVFANIAMARKNAEREVGEQISISQFRPANVLIADDIHDNRRLVTGHFKGSAISFFEADNGRDALTLLSQIQMDMVLMDLRMPVLNGYETITAMKQDDTLQHIPVVAFTASVMGEDMEKVDQYGFDDYLRKPVSRQELLRVASQFLPLADPAVEHSETALETDDLALPQLSESLEILENEMLPRWQAIKDKGDFELIGQFTENLHSHALQYSSSSIAGFADRLQEYVTSFDIIEVDSMMKQFPVLVSAMKQQLASLGRENERQI
jgi:signal transduction histidine kinase/CheY-like chemotaxis protein